VLKENPQNACTLKKEIPMGLEKKPILFAFPQLGFSDALPFKRNIIFFTHSPQTLPSFQKNNPICAAQESTSRV